MKVKEESEKIGLKLNIQKIEVKTTTTTTTTEIMESSPIISWQIEGGKVEAVTDFIFLGSHWRIDAFELWCWRRLLRVPWTARKSNQSILREISPEYSLEGLMLKLKLHLSLATWLEELTHLERPWCWERLKVGEKGNDRGWDGWMASPTWWTWVWVSSRRPCVLQSMEFQKVRHHWVTELIDFLRITVYGDCSHEIRRCLLLRRKLIANLVNVKVKFTQSCLTLLTPWTIQYMEFSRPEYWSG